MTQSILPETFEQETIIGMLPGDTGYTVLWAMWADENRVLWINGDYSIHKSPGGTVHMKIKRTIDGVVVKEATIEDHKYMAGPSSWDMSPNKLPVTLE